MLWAWYALLSAFSLATTDALSKRVLAREKALLIAWVRAGYALPFLLLFLPFVSIPELDAAFWKAALPLLPLDIIALWLYMQAIKVSPLSLTLPFLSFTPVFLLGTAWVMLGEFPDASGLAGVLLIFAGAYLLNINSLRQGLLAPFKSIARERGSLMMIGVALIYSVNSNLGKIAIMHSEPVFFGVYFNIAVGLVLLPVLRLGPRGGWRAGFARPKEFLAIGFFNSIMMLSHFLALDLTLVAYMISLKRTSLLFAVLYGGLLFKEQNLRERFTGCLLMVLGVVSILL